MLGLLWLTFAVGITSCAPVSTVSPPSAAEATKEAEQNAVDPTQDLLSSGTPDLADVTEIHDAARKGNVEKVRSLINTNSDLVNATDNFGITPLMLASQEGQEVVVELLLENGADPRVSTQFGTTALNIAASAYRFEHWGDFSGLISGLFESARTLLGESGLGKLGESKRPGEFKTKITELSAELRRFHASSTYPIYVERHNTKLH